MVTFNVLLKSECRCECRFTQFFFNPDAYSILSNVFKAGVIFPLHQASCHTNASNLIRFADGTGAEIPRWIRKQLAAYGDDSQY